VSPVPDDATRRTWLANERTWLAWLRTGLTAAAVALAVGKVVPDVADARHRWPYAVLGAGYAVLGAGLVLYGETRRRAVVRAIDAGSYAGLPDAAGAALTALAALLIVASGVLVVAD
jgi:putative membrane protein